MNKKRIEYESLSLKSYEVCICIAYSNEKIKVSASLPVPT